MSLIASGSKNITAQINLLGNQIPDRPAYWWLIDLTVIAKTHFI